MARILIVDDEIKNCKLLSALLEPEGYATQCAANAEEALALIAQHAPDLILVDVMMPGMDGYELAALLKANPVTSRIPIIMVSAQSDRSARLAGLKAGAEEFLTKPVDRAELWLRVRNLLRLKAMGDYLQNHSAMLEQQVQNRTADLRLFRASMDATADAILLVRRSTLRFIEINATACAMLGYTRQELFEVGPSQLGAATTEQLASTYDSIIAGGTSNALTQTQMRRKDGSYLQVEVHRQALPSGDDWIIVSVMRDITERNKVEEHLHHLAHYDTLTGLPNRTLFYQALKKALLQASEKEWAVAVMFIDLDHFKNVNDTLGHAIGDELLSQFSRRIVECVRIRDTVGRLGGDEFALILLMENHQQGAATVANKIRETLRAPFDLRGEEVAITASIGITVYPDDASDPETLIKYADTAMYRAKQAGRDTFRFFTPQMNAEVLARHELETALRKAVDNDEFILHYQPKVDLNSGLIVGVEALLRWERPGHGLIFPAKFISTLEETGLIVRVGSWVIAAACKQIALWTRSAVGPLQVSVNVAGRQFMEGNLEMDVVQALTDNGVTADLLELELTEGSLITNTEHTITILDNLKERGVQISIDDFGTGYSCLAYLRRFPIDKLKIDIAFIRDITNNPDDAAIALTIIRMAHSLKMDVIAEGVETQMQLAYLRHYGCDQIQGYCFSPPLPVLELEQLLREKRCLPPRTNPTALNLEKLHMSGPHARKPHIRRSLSGKRPEALMAAPPTCGHLVHIYEDDTMLMDTLKGFISGGMLTDEAAIVIATQEHLDILDSQLIADGIDVATARTQDRYIPIVAADMLAKMMHNGWPDDELFASMMMPILARARGNGRKVRIFGEMVSILWSRGHSGATVHLETLWDQLCHQHSLSLLCAYPRVVFIENAVESIAHICSMHYKAAET